MIILGIIAILMVGTSALITLACMLSSQCGRAEDQRERTMIGMTGQLSGAPAARQRSLEVY